MGVRYPDMALVALAHEGLAVDLHTGELRLESSTALRADLRLEPRGPIETKSRPSVVAAELMVSSSRWCRVRMVRRLP